MLDESEIEFSIVLVQEIRADGKSVWTALHPDLFGCNATGASQDEALANLGKSRSVWLKVAEKAGMPIPTPVGEPSVTTMFAVSQDANVQTNVAQDVATEVQEVLAAA